MELSSHTDSETGTELLARLGNKIDTFLLDPNLFPEGVKQQTIYEFYGKEGTGKTQALLHLVAKCILPNQWKSFKIGGLCAGVIFLDTDNHFNMVRLTGILEHHLKQAILGDSSVKLDAEIEPIIKSSLKRLCLVRCNNSLELLLTLCSLQPVIGSRPYISLLIIDSISAFYWKDRNLASDQSTIQNVHMVKICDALHNIVVKYKLTAFVSKLALFEKKSESSKVFSITTSHVEHNEYLGRAWNKLVTHRLLFEKKIEIDLKGVFTDQIIMKYDFGFCNKSNEAANLKIYEGGLTYL